MRGYGELFELRGGLLHVLQGCGAVPLPLGKRHAHFLDGLRQQLEQVDSVAARAVHGGTAQGDKSEHDQRGSERARHPPSLEPRDERRERVGQKHADDERNEK